MPTVRTGSLATAGAVAVNGDQLEVDMMEDVFQYDPPESPMLTVITKRLQSKRATQTTVKHLEDDVLPESDQLNGNITDSQSYIIVDEPTYHREGDLIRIVSTGETVRVEAVNNSSGRLDVERSWGSTAAAAATDNDYLMNMGAAEPEGDMAPVAKSTVTTTGTNYAQILKTVVHLSKTLENAANYGGNERMRQRKKAGAKHARLWEQILLHGEKRESTSIGDTAVRSCGGLDEFISTNVLAAGGVLTESEFQDFIGDCMRYSVRGRRKRKALLASRELKATISSWGSNKLQTNSQARATYGIEVSTYISPFGTLDIIDHPLLELGYAGYGYIVDFDGIWYRPYRRTMLDTNIQARGEDAWKDQYLTEASFSFALEKAFGKITGVTF